MIITLTIVSFLIITLITFIDLTTKKVPAFLTTSLIFLIAMVNMADPTTGLIHLAYGVIAFLFAYIILSRRESKHTL